MLDKNGTEIRTGQAVRITGAYHKSYDGLFAVTGSPGDPGWDGPGHGLVRITPGGRISRARHGSSAWPIRPYPDDACLAEAINEWNGEHAAIEVVELPDMAGVARYFGAMADLLAYGGDGRPDGPDRERREHYRAVAARIA